MEIIQIILSIVVCITYSVLIGLAITVFFYMRRQQREMLDIKKLQTRMFILVMSEHLRNDVNQLNDMNKELCELVDDERYEDADRLKITINELKKSTLSKLHRFQQEFGDTIFELKVTKIGEPDNDEKNE